MPFEARAVPGIAKQEVLVLPSSSGLLTLGLLCLAHFLIDLYSSGLGAMQPILVDKLSLNLRQAGLAGGVLIFFSSVMQPLYGYWSDRLHTRMFTVLAPAVAGVFISAIALAPGFLALLPLVALGGAGVASFHPQASAWASASSRGARGRWMATFISAGTLGMALGPSFFSGLVSTLGFDRTLWAAVPGVLVTFALFFWLPSSRPDMEQGPRQTDWAALRSAWKPLTIHYFLVFIRSTIQITFAQLLPLYLYRERGFSVSGANHVLSLYLTCGAIGGFLGGHLADRLGGRAVIMFSMIGSVPFLALFFLTEGVTALVSLALGGLILLFTIPVNVVMAQAIVPGQAGTVSALMMGFAWGMAGLIFIPLIGWVSDVYSLHQALSSLLVFPLAGFLLSMALPRDRSLH